MKAGQCRDLLEEDYWGSLRWSRRIWGTEGSWGCCGTAEVAMLTLKEFSSVH